MKNADDAPILQRINMPHALLRIDLVGGSSSVEFEKADVSSSRAGARNIGRQARSSRSSAKSVKLTERKHVHRQNFRRLIMADG